MGGLRKFGRPKKIEIPNSLRAYYVISIYFDYKIEYFNIVNAFLLFTRYPIVARAWQLTAVQPLGRVKVSCIQNFMFYILNLIVFSI